MDRCLPVPHVIDIKIHIVHSEILKTCVDHILDMFLSADAAFDLLLCSGKELCCHNDILTLRKVTECTAYILFACAALVPDRCIKEIDAQIKCVLNDLSGMFFINGPAVLSSSGITESHAAKADT